MSEQKSTTKSVLESAKNFASNLANMAEYQSHKLAPKVKKAGESFKESLVEIKDRSVELTNAGLEKGSKGWQSAKEGASFVSHKVNEEASQKFQAIKEKAPSLDDINAKMEILNEKFSSISSEVKDVAVAQSHKAKEGISETISKVKEKFNHSNKI